MVRVKLSIDNREELELDYESLPSIEQIKESLKNIIDSLINECTGCATELPELSYVVKLENFLYLEDFLWDNEIPSIFFKVLGNFRFCFKIEEIKDE